MDTIFPIVMTSKAAQKDLNNIKTQHSDILRGIQDQQMKVAQYNVQKMQEKQMSDQQNQANQMESEKFKADTETKKMEMENKRRELDIKSQALSI